MADSANPIKRILNPDSPIYVPILMNSLFIFIFGIFYIYNLSELPSVEQLDKIVKRGYSETQKPLVSEQKSPINIAAAALGKGALTLTPFQGPTGVAAAALGKAATAAAAKATAAAVAALAKTQ